MPHQPVIVGLIRGAVYAALTAAAAFVVASADNLSATKLAPYVPVIVLAARFLEAWVLDQRRLP
jgi:hypothetical protein